MFFVVVPCCMKWTPPIGSTIWSVSFAFAGCPFSVALTLKFQRVLTFGAWVGATKETCSARTAARTAMG